MFSPLCHSSGWNNVFIAWLEHRWPWLQRANRTECVQLVLSVQNESCHNSGSILLCPLWPLGWGWDSCHPQSVGWETHPECVKEGKGVCLYVVYPAFSCMGLEHMWWVTYGPDHFKYRISIPCDWEIDVWFRFCCCSVKNSLYVVNIFLYNRLS